MTYDGGKGGAGVAQWIINQIPPHRVFISPFLGNCAVLRSIRPAAQQIGVETNPRVLAAFWTPPPAGVIVIHGAALDFLRSYPWRGDEFVYCDPPYLMETRSYQEQVYAFAFAEREEHAVLLALLTTLPCAVALSGYWSQLYADELATWRSSTFQTVKHSGAPATEWLWMNYPEPLELHDYRYLGRNFRERERIRRKKARWLARLQAMRPHERYALMEAIAALRAGGIAENDAEAGAIATGGDSAQTCRIASADDAGIHRQIERGWPPSSRGAIPSRIAMAGEATRSATELP